MPITYTPQPVSDEIKLHYTVGEDEKELVIMARRIEPVTPVKSSVLYIDYRTAAERYQGCRWSDDFYCRLGTDIGSGQRSYLHELNDIYADADIRTAMTKINDMIDELSADSQSGMENVITITSDDSTQYYNRAAGDDKQKGQLMSYETEGGSCCIGFYIQTTYTPDPVSTVYMPGIFEMHPDPEGSYYGVKRQNYTGSYTTEDPPMISVWSLPVIMDDEDHDGDHYGETVRCLLIILCNPNAPQPVVHTFASLNLFIAQEHPDEPTTTDPEGTVTPYGWVGDFHFDSDSDDISAVTGHDYINRWQHGIRLYVISDTQASAFMDALWGMTLQQAADLAIDSLFFRGNVDFLRGVICLHKLPVPVIPSLTTDPLTIMGYDLWSKFPGLGAFARLEGTYGSIIQVPTDEIPIDYTFGDTVWLDWDRCRAMVRLPFVGIVPIDIKAIRGGTIQVCYNIDALTGNLVAQIFCRSGVQSKPKILLYQGSGNCALPIPYSGNTEGAYKQLGAMAGIAGGIAGLAAGSPLGTLSAIGAAGSMLSSAGSSADYKYMQSETSSLTDLSCKLIITGSVPVVPEKQREIEGYSAATTARISKFVGTGFLSGTVHPDFDGATSEELEEIERLFETGVII